ncbi:MAG: tRNA (adenosine(37)-N6)-threonylcarbamoyltransferase complex dimerization subunit type 1 TsaB, partial [Blastocatellia bacterium]
MNRDSTSHTVLAIESAIQDGSIALFRDGKEIASVGGSDDVSRAEELLPNIEKLFNDTGIKFDEIDLIAVSRGPGSYTGIRIGIATVLGLARALNISCAGVSVLEAMTILGDRST